MAYRVKMTENAISQMEEAVSYISKELLAPDTAKRWADSMKAAVASLNFMPARIPLTEEEPWRSQGIHKMVVDHFLVYFWVDDNNDVVWVTAVVYGRRDQRKVLEAMSFH